jgi:hypothetical protein
VGPIETRLKQIISAVCAEHQAEIEELEVMPDHVQRHGQCGPSIRYSSADEADQRAFIAVLAPRISRLEAETAQFMDEQLLCLDNRRCASFHHQAVY